MWEKKSNLLLKNHFLQLVNITARDWFHHISTSVLFNYLGYWQASVLICSNVFQCVLIVLWTSSSSRHWAVKICLWSRIYFIEKEHWVSFNMVSEVGLKKNIEFHLTITIKNSLINLIKMENYVQQIEGTSLIKRGS